MFFQSQLYKAWQLAPRIVRINKIVACSPLDDFLSILAKRVRQFISFILPLLEFLQYEFLVVHLFVETILHVFVLVLLVSPRKSGQFHTN